MHQRAFLQGRKAPHACMHNDNDTTAVVLQATTQLRQHSHVAPSSASQEATNKVGCRLRALCEGAL